jgi:glycosyltransferase involved in cell wall biosynthesis
MRISYLINSILDRTDGNQRLIAYVKYFVQCGNEVRIITYTDKPDWMPPEIIVVKIPPKESFADHVPPSDIVIATYFLNAAELERINAPVKIYYAQGDQYLLDDGYIPARPDDKQQWKEYKARSLASYQAPEIKLIVNSGVLFRHVQQKTGRTPDAILRPGIDTTIFRPLERSRLHSRPRILIVGPDTLGHPLEPLYFKGMKEIKEALKIVKAKFSEITIVRISNTDPDIYDDVSCEFYVTPSDEMKTYLYGTSDILISASHYESIPLPPMEAMASGVAVVTTQNEGALEFCRDGINALLVPIGSPEKIAEATIALLKNRVLQNQIISGGFITARQRSIDREFTQLEKIISDFYEGSKKGAFVSKLLETKGEQPVISVIIDADEDETAILQTISHAAEMTAVPFEFIVLASTGVIKVIAESIKKIAPHNAITFIEKSVRRNYASRLNDAVSSANGSYVAIVPSGTLLMQGWHSGFLEAFERESNIGFLRPLTHLHPVFEGALEGRSESQLADFCRQYKIDNRDRLIPTAEFPIGCVVFRKSLIDKIGWFDEVSSLDGCEFDDIALRASLENFKNYIVCDTIVVSQSSSEERSKEPLHHKWSEVPLDSDTGVKLLVVKALSEAIASAQQGNLDNAVMHIVNALKLVPTEPRLFETLGNLFIEHQKYGDAIGLMQKVPKSIRTTIPIDEMMVRAYTGAGEIAKAIDVLKSAPHGIGRSPKALLCKATLELIGGEQSMAVKTLNAITELYPICADAYYSLGVIEWEQGSQEKAYELLERGFVLDPTSLLGLRRYVNASVHLEKSHTVEQRLREAVSLYPHSRALKISCATIFGMNGKHKLALELAEDVLLKFGIDDETLSLGLGLRKELGPIDRFTTDPTRKTVSLSMIAKNEEQRLPQCLSVLSPLVDEIIVVDTGSTDRTEIVATIFGAKVFHFKWNGDFSAARNISLSKARGNWILVMDADEVISPDDQDEFRTLIEKADVSSVYQLTTRNYFYRADWDGWIANDGTYREQAGSGWIPSTKTRLFPRNESIFFEGAVHELVDFVCIRQGLELVASSIPVHHYGTLNEKKFTSKGETYKELGAKKIQMLGTENPKALLEYGLQLNQLGCHADAIEIWEKLIKLNPKHARALRGYANALVEIGRFADALPVLLKAIDTEPGTREGYIGLGRVFLLLGNADKMVELLEEFNKLEPDYPPGMALLTVGYICSGKPIEAGEILRIFQRKKVSFLEAFYEIARVCYRYNLRNYAISVLEFLDGRKELTPEMKLLLNKYRKEPHTR